MGAATAGAATASKTVELALKGKHRDVAGQLFAAGLLLTLLLSLAVADRAGGGRVDRRHGRRSATAASTS